MTSYHWFREDQIIYQLIDGVKVKKDFLDIIGQPVYKVEDCFATGLKMLPEKFYDFIDCCLLPNNDQFEAFIRNDLQADFENVTLEDIKNLHPVLAFQLANKFGCKKYRIIEPNGNVKWQIKQLDKKIQKILEDSKNFNIMSYISTLVEYINTFIYI